jgi:hypothetical protein
MTAMIRIALLATLIAAAASGCYSEESYGYAQPAYGAPAYGYAQPGYADPAAVGYVGVAPGVEVVADYPYPVFFTGGLYWRSFGGVWYSSRVYSGGWGINYNVPVGVRGIARPEMYAHYHPAGAQIRYSGGVGVGARVGGGYANGGAYRGGAVQARPAAPAAAARPSTSVRAAPAGHKK